MFDLTGKSALITGASGGIGADIARGLHAAGANVGLSGTRVEPLEALAAELGERAFVLPCNLSDMEAVAELPKQAIAAMGSVDILVNNYGTGTRGTWSSVSDSDFLSMYQTNVLSASRMVQGLVEPMKASGWGRSIQRGTIGSHQPNAIMPHYYASKGALATLMVGLANELADTGITVNTVSPGLIHTDEVEAGYRKLAAKNNWGDDWNSIVKHIVANDYPNPSGRIASREEVADLVVYLASDKSSFVTGANFDINGGLAFS